jgi:hypothetical protein
MFVCFDKKGTLTHENLWFSHELYCIANSTEYWTGNGYTKQPSWDPKPPALLLEKRQKIQPEICNSDKEPKSGRC